MKRLAAISSLTLLLVLTAAYSARAGTPKAQSTVGTVCQMSPVTDGRTPPLPPSTQPPAPTYQELCPATFTLQLQQFPYRPGKADLRATIDYDCMEPSQPTLGMCEAIDQTTMVPFTAVPVQHRPLYLYLDGQRIKTINLDKTHLDLALGGDTGDSLAAANSIGYDEWYKATYDIGTLRMPKREGWHRLQIGMFGDEALFDGTTLEARSAPVWFWVP